MSVFLSPIIGFIFTIVGWFLRPVVEKWVIWWFPSDSTLAGYYCTEWNYVTDDASKRSITVHDIVCVEQGRGKIRGRVIFSTASDRYYEFEGTAILDKPTTRYVGQWKNIANADYAGDFALYITPSSPICLNGYWAGLGRDATLQTQHWTWTKFDCAPPMREVAFNARKHRNALTKFIAQHQEQAVKAGATDRIVAVEGLKLQVIPGVFNPTLGSVSQHFYTQVVNKLSQVDVLDVGTGTGFYALSAARQKCRVSACDISREAVSIAEANAARNNIEGIKFYHSNIYRNIPVDCKFDVIISNLPFTSPINGRIIRDTAYFRALCIIPSELAEFVLGAFYRLKPGGIAYFSFGTSGDVVYLDILRQLVAPRMELHTIKVIDHMEDLGERFYIYQLKMKAIAGEVRAAGSIPELGQ